MNEIVKVIDKTPRVSTFDLWEKLGYANHDMLKRVIFKNKTLLESKGYLISDSVASETKKAGRPDKSFFLNERQFVLLAMLVKNTDESLVIKEQIADEFFRMREKLQELNRPSEHMERIRKLLLLDAPMDWVKLFPNEFYVALMALYGATFIGNKSTPGYCAQITRRWIYEIVLPKELLTDIDKKQGDEKKHTWFTEQNGRIALIKQIEAVTMLARVSQGRKDFEARCATMFLNAPLQLNFWI